MKNKLIKKVKNFFLLTLFPFFLSSTLFGAPGKSNSVNQIFEFNYENATINNFSPGGNDENKFWTLTSQEDVGKYFLIRIGVQIPSFKANTISTYFFPSAEEEKCELENSPGKTFQIGSNNEVANQKIKILRSCLSLRIEDPEKKPLEYNPNQVNCQIQKLEDFAVLISGGDCFFRIKSNQNLKMELVPNESCKERNFLESNKISPTELMTIIQTYVYPKEEIGQVFTPVKFLFDKKINLQLLPGKELLQSSTKEDDDGALHIRPDHYINPDIYVSLLKISNEVGYGSGIINLGMIISSFGSNNICSEGICSSYSNYDFPVAPEVILFEIDEKTGNKYELGSKRIGGRYPGQWMGEIISMLDFSGIFFEKGKKYALEIIFSDPEEDYNNLKKYYKSLLSSGNGLRLRRGSLRAGIDSFGSIGTLSTLGELGVLRELPSVREMIFSGISDASIDPLSRIIEFLGDSTFPPIYSKICNKDTSICDKPTGKENLKMVVKFAVENVVDNRVILKEGIAVEKMEKNGKKELINLDLNKKPSIKCTKNN